MSFGGYLFGIVLVVGAVLLRRVHRRQVHVLPLLPRRRRHLRVERRVLRRHLQRHHPSLCLPVRRMHGDARTLLRAAFVLRHALHRRWPRHRQRVLLPDRWLPSLRGPLHQGQGLLLAQVRRSRCNRPPSLRSIRQLPAGRRRVRRPRRFAELLLGRQGGVPQNGHRRLALQPDVRLAVPQHGRRVLARRLVLLGRLHAGSDLRDRLLLQRVVHPDRLGDVHHRRRLLHRRRLSGGHLQVGGSDVLTARRRVHHQRVVLHRVLPRRVLLGGLAPAPVARYTKIVARYPITGSTCAGWDR